MMGDEKTYNIMKPKRSKIENPRCKQVNFRLTEEEYYKLLELSKGQLSEYIRWRLLEFKPDQLSINQMRQVMGQMVKDQSKKSP